MKKPPLTVQHPPPTADKPHNTVADTDASIPEDEAHADLMDGVVTLCAADNRTALGAQLTEQLPVLTPLDIASAGPDQRLLMLNAIGAGGMGEVFQVHDRTLNRALAMKVLHTHLHDRAHLRDRFLKEAQITAQLAHPGIPPVHELGTIDDRRFFFTMKQVHGRTLADIISTHDSLSELRRLEIFQKVCEAVAYAHARGVIHCDLKPHNIMVGAFGEVLVMDWGLARMVPTAGDFVGAAGNIEPPVQIAGVSGHDPNTPAGTPAYMPPEQALGDNALLGPPADIYALGLILYELFTGRHPDLRPAIQRMMSPTEGLPSFPKRPGSIADDTLDAILVRTLHADPADRYPHASALSDDIARWREGAARREKALALTREAERILPNAQAAREAAQRLLYQAHTMLAALGPGVVAEQKAAAWEIEDRAASLSHKAARQTADAVQRLQGALAYAPDLPEARSLLAHIHFERHQDAEHRLAWDEAELHEAALRAYDVGEYADYLAGTATLSLHTEPPCSVRIHRYKPKDRILTPELWLELDHTPLQNLNLPIGSYLITFHHPSLREPVRYPISISRQHGWSFHPPASSPASPASTTSTARPIPLAPARTLADAELYIPEGWAKIGNQARVWVDGFCIQTYPVTARAFARFLATPEGAPWRKEVLRDGLNLWHPDWPAVGMSWEAANAYAAWCSHPTTPWRLPTESEWEKAARGVDARPYPWGDFADPTFCHVRSPEHLPQSPASIHTFPTDSSPYGLRGAGGNVRDWCAALPSTPPDSPHPVRGGSWRLPLNAALINAPSTLPPRQGFPDVGFRLARSL